MKGFNVHTRNAKNIRNNGEVFTPEHIVEKMMAVIPDSAWGDPEYIFIEPTCGHGNFIVKILQKRLDHGIPPDIAVKTIIGMDISQENIDECHDRMREIVGELDFSNVFVVTDSLSLIKEYGYGYGELYEKVKVIV